MGSFVVLGGVILKIENVMDMFRRLSGLDTETVLKFRFMCDSALDGIRTKLKSDRNIEAYSGRIEFAAAALAYYRYVLWSVSENSGEDITVGEISVKRSASLSEQLKATEKLYREAFENIGDIYDCDGFVFERI